MHTARATTTAFRGRPSTRATAAIAALLALLASSLGTTGPSAAATLDDLATRVVVEARADLGAVASAVAEHGGEVVEVLAPFGMVVADVPAGAVDDLEDEAATGTVTEDTPLQVQSAEGVEHAVRATVAAPTAADAGAGVGVVVVDTGVADHPDLGDRVVARYTFARGHERRALDPHGHGTFLAGLVAGSGDASDGRYAGVAPGAHLVSVRVADADGTTSLSRVLTGLAAADLARDRHDAPVVLLALSGPTGDVPDPVMIVLEMLWSRGSTVVVPAGNGDLAPLPTPLPDRGNGRGNGNGNGNGNGRGVGPGPAGWSWDGWSWDGWSWDGWSWDGWSWDGDSWSGWSWDGWSWDGWSWDGWSWDGWTWDGWSWDGWSWSNDTWGAAPA